MGPSIYKSIKYLWIFVKILELAIMTAVMAPPLKFFYTMALWLKKSLAPELLVVWGSRLTSTKTIINKIKTKGVTLSISLTKTFMHLTQVFSYLNITREKNHLLLLGTFIGDMHRIIAKKS